MANRYKKNGAQGVTIEGEYRHSGSGDFFSRENRLRRKDATERRNVYENRRQGPPLPRERRPPYTFNGPRAEKDLRKQGRKWFPYVNIFGRATNPIIQAADLLGLPTPGDIAWNIARQPGGIKIDAWDGGRLLELKCDNPLIQPTGYIGRFNGLNNGNSCGLPLQASPGVNTFANYYVDPNAPTADRTWIVCKLSGTLNRRTYATVYWERGVPGTTIGGSPYPFSRQDARFVPDVQTPANPNILRNLPSPAPAVAPRLPADAIIDRIASRTRTRGAVRTGGGGRPPGRTVPTKPGPPSPPKSGQKERKGLSTMRRLLGLLDAISEGAEVVDAVYEALPEKTKKQWDCSGGRGLIDSAGQYGIDKADCKLMALWHNWHKVDIDKAVRNIIANQLQDRVIGDLSRAQPVNVGRATEDAQKLVNDVLEWIFESSGLTS